MSLEQLRDDVAWDVLIANGTARPILADAMNHVEITLAGIKNSLEVDEAMVALGEMPEREALGRRVELVRRRQGAFTFKKLVERQQQRINAVTYRKLLDSVFQHRLSTRIADLEPSEADLVLWALVPEAAE